MGCISAAMAKQNGGDRKAAFRNGARSSVVSAAFSTAAGPGVVEQGVAATLAGGTNAELGGGKFENGAKDAALSYAVSASLQHYDPKGSYKYRYGRPKDSRAKHKGGGVVFVGGAADSTSGLLRDQYEQFLIDNSDVNAAYFEWDQVEELAAWIDKNGLVTVVGHSYGAAAAANVVAAGHVVDVLITLDPVSRSQPNYADVKNNSNTWVNVDATQSAGNQNLSDYIAQAGGDWGSGPDGYADRHVTLNGKSHNSECMLKMSCR